MALTFLALSYYRKVISKPLTHFIRRNNRNLYNLHARGFGNAVSITYKCGELCAKDIGKNITLRGFLQYQRLGKFCILRDSYGMIQILISSEILSDLLIKTPFESYLEVSGEVQLRPENQVNKSLATGEVEVHATSISVLNEAKKNIPFLIRNHNKPTEKIGLEHRYLDLRQKYLQDNLHFRSKLGKKMRDFLQDEKGFIEVTTPTLSFNTEGGSQEFVVPSQSPGKFYNLVQSPQIYKQLIMVGGIEKYFQFAVCYRDEGGKPDRQPEFMQLDLEVMNANSEEVQDLMEMIIVKSWPENTDPPRVPFPAMKYQQAMDDYGTDKPDTRFQWKFVDVSSLLVQANIDIFSSQLSEEESLAKAFVVPAGEKFIGKSIVQKWEKIARQEIQLPGLSILHVTEANQLNGRIAKRLSTSQREALIKKMDASVGDTIVLSVGHKTKVLKLLGKLRIEAADVLESGGISVRDPNVFSFLWVVDFPLFEVDDKSGQLVSCHHPFTAPQSHQLDKLYSNPLEVLSQHYDLVLNGCEIGGGSIRIHSSEMQRRVFDLLNIETRKMNFFLNALDCGAPPHGGIALGFDRYVSILRGAKSVREVMAFPKTSEGRCLMSGAPSQIQENIKALYHLETK